MAANLATLFINSLADGHPSKGWMLADVAPGVAAGVAIVESSSVACTQAGAHLVNRGTMACHYQALNLLTRLLNEMSLAGSPAVAGLQATTFTPEVILAFLALCEL